MSFLNKIFGDSNEKYLRKLKPIVDKINGLEADFSRFSVTQLKEKTREFKERLSKKETLDNILPEAFALCREGAKRTLHQRHFDVQLLAGVVLHQGKIAEMKTGEGKTLAATLPLYLNALEEKGCHLITVNDYLARRDTVWMGQIYHLLGLTVGCLNHEQTFLYDPNYKKPDEEKDKIRDELGSFYVVEDFLRPCSKKEAYSADITYGTNNEFGFDYLRDNMVLDFKELSQRELNFAILDEVDSVLIDEARTPLIISQPDIESSKWYQEFARIIPRLNPETDYQIDEKMRTVSLTESGIEKIEKILGMENIYQEKGQRYLHHLEESLRAQAVNPVDGKPLFARDRDYVVREGKVVIVDEFTGRLMPGRRWSGGLHQAIEAKEGVEVRAESKTLATITFQNLFRTYRKLAGMTGTATTSAEEFDKVYNLPVVLMPTNKPMVREDFPDKVYKTESGKFRAIVEEAKKRHEMGQPVLIGTTSIEKNEYLAKMLEREGITCQILNAKHHEREGEIIAQAGKEAQVTVATNMAGRGVDIILGGNPPRKEEAERIKKLGGLHIIGAQRHEARRIDNQLRGRAGRQGDPGSSQFFISLDDTLLRIFGGDRVKNLMSILKIPEDQPIETKIISGVIEKSQTSVEGLNFDLRKYVLEYDDVIAKHRNKIYSKRKEILKKDYKELKDFFLEIIEKEIEKIIKEKREKEFISQANTPPSGFEGIFDEMKTIFPISLEVHSRLKELSSLQEISNYLKNLAKKYFGLKEEKEGKENMEKILRFVCLNSVDIFWSEHLETMDELKDSVKLRAYGGRDPLVEYKTEGHRIFKELENSINSQIARTVFKLTIKEGSASSASRS